MSVLTVCPSCSFESPEIRCPRCNALKVVGCTGACSMCGSSCETGKTSPAVGSACPSDDAHHDDDHPGTPLTR